MLNIATRVQIKNATMSVNQIPNSSMSWKKNDLMGEGDEDELVIYNPENLICL